MNALTLPLLAERVAKRLPVQLARTLTDAQEWRSDIEYEKARAARATFARGVSRSLNELNRKRNRAFTPWDLLNEVLTLIGADWRHRPLPDDFPTISQEAKAFGLAVLTLADAGSDDESEEITEIDAYEVESEDFPEFVLTTDENYDPESIRSLVYNSRNPAEFAKELDEELGTFFEPRAYEPREGEPPAQPAPNWRTQGERRRLQNRWPPEDQDFWKQFTTGKRGPRFLCWKSSLPRKY